MLPTTRITRTLQFTTDTQTSPVYAEGIRPGETKS